MAVDREGNIWWHQLTPKGAVIIVLSFIIKSFKNLWEEGGGKVKKEKKVR